MKKALIVAYFFPPLGGGGVQRTSKFIKYLPQFGWEPAVLTVKNSNHLKDPSLLDDVSDNVDIYYAPILGEGLASTISRHLGVTRKWLSIPDDYVGWYPFALSKANEIVKKEKIDVIYTTSSPVISHFVGRKIKKRFGIPWVADFRDPWTTSPAITYPSMLIKGVEERWEKEIVCDADIVINVSDSLTGAMKKQYSDLPLGKWHTIQNGFDPADYSIKELQRSNKFTISYVGSLYWDVDPTTFLEAISSLSCEEEGFRSDIEIYFVGTIETKFQRLIERYDTLHIHTPGYQSHKKAIEFQMRSDLLLAIIETKSTHLGSLGGKVYEYLATGKPIVVLLPEDNMVDRTILSAGPIHFVHHGNVTQMKEAIKKIYQDYKSGKSYASTDMNYINRYNRIYLTEKLAALFDSILVE